MKAIFFVLILITTGCNTKISQNIIDKTATPIIENFFERLSKKDPASALDQLLSSNPYISLNDSATTDLKKKFILINEVAGSFAGKRLLKKRFLEDDIAIYSYMAKYEKKFYRFIFMYYNNGKNIRLYKFLFDDDIDIELEGSLKLFAY